MNAPSSAVLVLVVALGCKGSGAPPSATAASPARPPVVVAADPPARATVVELAAPEAQTVLDAWLRAQNTGDFAGYDRLYAPRFTGVRRSGPRVRRFDRAGWMGDRRTMFGAAMEVAARDVAITTGPGVATVRFTQDFTQGRFHDSGPKEVVLVRAGGALVIAREEMLESRLDQATSTPTPPPPGAMMHVLSYGGVRWVVLAPAPDDGSWARGAPTLVDRSGQVVVTRSAINSGAIPAAFRGLGGHGVRAYGGDGAACEARLGELAVLGRVDVHFGTEQRWAGERDDGTRGAPATDEVVAREAWSESDGGLLLVARLDDAASCAAPRWCRFASQPAANVFASTAPDAELAARVMARFRALPAWRRLQADYRAGGATQPLWDSHAAASAPVLRVWQAPGSERRFVTVNAATMVGGCAEFSGALTVVFETGGPLGLILHSDDAEPGVFTVEAAVDLDADGVPEFVTADGYLRRTGTVFRSAAPLAVPSHDCPC